ncbi:MAG: formate dehydrogenase, partial [Xanthobacteraceae bacterium]|nr:formate dehydrogenase [Xanthobacteraceae bacterium]
MTMKVFIPIDAAAVACGADDVVDAVQTYSEKHMLGVDIVRTGSRGMHWLEPLVEVETPEGRIAYGPVTPDDVPSLLKAFNGDGKHPLRQGVTEEIPWLKNQNRLSFVRCGVVDPRSVDDYKAHGGYKGLERALTLGSDGIIADVKTSGLRGRGGAGFPTAIKWTTVAQA